MRKNTRATLAHWLSGEPSATAPAIHTDGDVIRSYSTWLTVRTGETHAIMNMTKYTRTTSVHQNAILADLEARGFDVEVVDDVPIGTRDSYAPFIVGGAK
tara:strand:- start:2793 stop:3092 length:300 start_codon:yes stop_codon:yes gene_type:complete